MSTHSSRNVSAYAAATAGAPLEPTTIERRAPTPHDVVIEITHCGICHSDIHQARDEWGGSRFPMVPGHEIVGRVIEVGVAVTKVRVGDRVGVGCLVDSCRTCEFCARDLEQFCVKGCAATYNGTEMDRTTPTYGGYSGFVVVTEAFVLRIPDGLDSAGVAPLLCAGITTYSPLRRWGVAAGKRVAVVGLGGLGHMAVKLAVAMGAEVTVLSSSASKEGDARRLGAHAFANSTELGAMKKLSARFDVIVDTVSAPHDYDAQLRTLRPEGVMAVVGAPAGAVSIRPFSLIGGSKTIAGSAIGGLRETQEMLDYCGAHGIVADVEVIEPSAINEAYDRVQRSDVRYRFVVDTSSLRG